MARLRQRVNHVDRQILSPEAGQHGTVLVVPASGGTDVAVCNVKRICRVDTQRLFLPLPLHDKCAILNGRDGEAITCLQPGAFVAGKRKQPLPRSNLQLRLCKQAPVTGKCAELYTGQYTIPVDQGEHAGFIMYAVNDVVTRFISLRPVFQHHTGAVGLREATLFCCHIHRRARHDADRRLPQSSGFFQRIPDDTGQLGLLTRTGHNRRHGTVCGVHSGKTLCECTIALSLVLNAGHADLNTVRRCVQALTFYPRCGQHGQCVRV